MKVKCDNCGYEWDYKGKMKLYATCSNCMRKTAVITIKEKDKTFEEMVKE